MSWIHVELILRSSIWKLCFWQFWSSNLVVEEEDPTKFFPSAMVFAASPFLALTNLWGKMVVMQSLGSHWCSSILHWNLWLWRSYLHDSKFKSIITMNCLLEFMGCQDSRSLLVGAFQTYLPTCTRDLCSLVLMLSVCALNFFLVLFAVPNQSPGTFDVGGLSEGDGR